MYSASSAYSVQDAARNNSDFIYNRERVTDSSLHKRNLDILSNSDRNIIRSDGRNILRSGNRNVSDSKVHDLIVSDSCDRNTVPGDTAMDDRETESGIVRAQSMESVTKSISSLPRNVKRNRSPSSERALHHSARKRMRRQSSVVGSVSKKSEDPFASQRCATQEALTRASLYHVCKRSPVLSNIDYKNTPTTVLEDLVSRYNAQTIREVPILFAKYVVKLCLQFVVNRYSGLRAYVDPSNMRVRIEDDEMLCLMRGKPSGPPNLLLVVTKNMLFSVIGHAVSRLKDDLLDKARRADEDDKSQPLMESNRNGDSVTVPIVLDEEHQQPMYGLRVADPPKKYDLNENGRTDKIRSQIAGASSTSSFGSVKEGSGPRSSPYDGNRNMLPETNDDDDDSEGSVSTYVASEIMTPVNGYPTKIVLEATKMKQEEEELVMALAAENKSVVDTKTSSPMQHEDATNGPPRERADSLPEREEDVEAVQEHKDSFRKRIDSMSSVSTARSTRSALDTGDFVARDPPPVESPANSVCSNNRNALETRSITPKRDGRSMEREVSRSPTYSATEAPSDPMMQLTPPRNEDSTYESQEDSNDSTNWKERSRIKPNFDYSAFDTEIVRASQEAVSDSEKSESRDEDAYSAANLWSAASNKDTKKRKAGSRVQRKKNGNETDKVKSPAETTRKRNTKTRATGTRKVKGKPKSKELNRFEELFGATEDVEQELVSVRGKRKGKSKAAHVSKFEEMFNSVADHMPGSINDTRSLHSPSPSVANSLLAESVSPKHETEARDNFYPLSPSRSILQQQHEMNRRSPSPTLSVLAKRRSLSPETWDPRATNESTVQRNVGEKHFVPIEPNKPTEVIVLDDEDGNLSSVAPAISSDVSANVSSSENLLRNSALGTKAAEKIEADTLLQSRGSTVGGTQKSNESVSVVDAIAISRKNQPSRANSYGSEASDDEHNYAAFGTKGTSSTKPSVIADVLLKPSEMKYKQRRDIDFFALVEANGSKVR